MHMRRNMRMRIKYFHFHFLEIPYQIMLDLEHNSAAALNMSGAKARMSGAQISKFKKTPDNRHPTELHLAVGCKNFYFLAPDKSTRQSGAAAESFWNINSGVL